MPVPSGAYEIWRLGGSGGGAHIRIVRVAPDCGPHFPLRYEQEIRVIAGKVFLENT